jgi:phage terminase small subunit
MEALKARREGLRKQQEEEATNNIPEPSVKEKPPNDAPPVKPIVREKKKKLSIDDFNNFKNEILTNLKPSERIVEVEKPIEKIVEKFVDRPVDRVVERIIEKPVNRVISGSELLDRLFFSKK